MRAHRFASFLTTAIILTTIMVTPVFSASSVSQVVTPASLTTEGGTTSGSLPALGLLQQSNTDDNPAAYLALSTPSVVYSGVFSFQLPSDIPPNRISALLLQLNFKLPADPSQVWTWSIFNWNSKLWIDLGDTTGSQPDLWNNKTFRVRNFSHYISNRQLRLRLQSNSNTNDFKLDYLALHVTYSPLTPTSTLAPVTSTSSKAALALPTTLTPTITNTPTITPSPTNSRTPTPSKTRTPTRTPTSSKTITPSKTPTTGGTVSTVHFAIGPGGSDVIPHQIVRAGDDKLYIFVNEDSSSTLRVYRTSSTGLPNVSLDFISTPVTLTESNNIISVDAVYGGGTIIFAVVNTQGGKVRVHPYDTSTNTFKSAHEIATNGGTFSGSPYVGTSGVSGAVDLNGKIHFAYWTSGNRIIHEMYTYNSSTNTLTQSGSDTTVDTAGSANHPSLAVSPADGSLTIAWVSEATTPEKILTRTRTSGGTWSTVDNTSNTVASTSRVWTSTASGINIDQGPSLLIGSTGTKHLIYIEECCEVGLGSSADYGRVHYVTNSGSGWVDTELNIFSHDPVLALSTSGNMYIIGHGHPNNIGGSASCLSMDNMCYIKKVGNGAWGNQVLFAAPPNFSFDASPSVKWSAVGWNRSNAVEFIFFETPYDSPTIYYGRLP